MREVFIVPLVGWIRPRTCLIGATVQNGPQNVFAVKFVRHKIAGQRIQKLRIRRRVGLTEIVDRFNDASPHELPPEPVDFDSCEIRVLRRCEPGRKRVQTVRHPYLLSLERYDIIEGRLLIVMELADRNVVPKVGQAIVTWGSKGGAPYVSGVPIGKVAKVFESLRETSYRAVIDPAVDFTALDLVGIVVPSGDSDAGIEADGSLR